MASGENAPHAAYEFDGETYNDDRLFVLYVAKCTVRDRGDGFVDTTIYHEEVPDGHLW